MIFVYCLLVMAACYILFGLLCVSPQYREGYRPPLYMQLFFKMIWPMIMWAVIEEKKEQGGWLRLNVCGFKYEKYYEPPK